MTRPKLIKGALSLFIIFHVTAIFIFPNPESILYRRTASVLATYGNFFGFNTTWRFFSPNPMVRIIEYDVFKADDTGQLQGETFRYPRDIKEEKFREIYNRKLNNAMFMVMRQNLLNEVLGPMMCRWHPGAETLAVSIKGRVIPTIESSKLSGAPARQELGAIQKQYMADVQCAGSADKTTGAAADEVSDE